jgi:hypothetical protein
MEEDGMRKVLSTLALTLILAICGGGGGTALAAVQTVTVDDPVGDIKSHPEANGPGHEKTSVFFDITQAAIAKDGGTFSLSMRLAAPVPVTPPNPAGNPGLFVWLFALDTQPGSISGFPFAPGVKRPFEHIVFLTWDGASFDSFLVDRTPLVSGGAATITRIPSSFNAERNEITFVLDEALIADPTTFSWMTATAVREGRFGNMGFQGIDFSAATNWP